MADDVRVSIGSESDVVTARQAGRELAMAQGFSSTDQTLIATAISEIARNIIVYARCGELILSRLQQHDRRGIRVVGRDRGPGIENVELAMSDGYSTANSLGMGLPGARRLMDEFDLVSAVDEGTTVTMSKWVR